MASWINAALLTIERALTRPSCNCCDDGETGPGLDSMPDIRRSMTMNIYFDFRGRAGLIMYLLHLQHNKTSGIAISYGEGLVVKCSFIENCHVMWVRGGEGFSNENIESVHVILPSRYRSEERRVGKECRSRWSP